MKVTRTKAAWIRDAQVPQGQSANGHFDCECGRKVMAGRYGEGPDIICECGLQYNNTGWIEGR
jgi:hypothetical protein